MAVVATMLGGRRGQAGKQANRYTGTHRDALHTHTHKHGHLIVLRGVVVCVLANVCVCVFVVGSVCVCSMVCRRLDGTRCSRRRQTFSRKRQTTLLLNCRYKTGPRPHANHRLCPRVPSSSLCRFQQADQGRLSATHRGPSSPDLALNTFCLYIYLWMYVLPAADL